MSLVLSMLRLLPSSFCRGRRLTDRRRRCRRSYLSCVTDDGRVHVFHMHASVIRAPPPPLPVDPDEEAVRRATMAMLGSDSDADRERQAMEQQRRDAEAARCRVVPLTLYPTVVVPAAAGAPTPQAAFVQSALPTADFGAGVKSGAAPVPGSGMSSAGSDAGSRGAGSVRGSVARQSSARSVSSAKTSGDTALAAGWTSRCCCPSHLPTSAIVLCPSFSLTHTAAHTSGVCVLQGRVLYFFLSPHPTHSRLLTLCL
jgi:hypothetical protein